MKKKSPRSTSTSSRKGRLNPTDAALRTWVVAFDERAGRIEHDLAAVEEALDKRLSWLEKDITAVGDRGVELADRVSQLKSLAAHAGEPPA